MEEFQALAGEPLSVRLYFNAANPQRLGILRSSSELSSEENFSTFFLAQRLFFAETLPFPFSA